MCAWKNVSAGAGISSTRVSVCGPSYLSFSPEAGHFLPIAKRICFHLKITTAIDCCGGVGSLRSMGLGEVGSGVDCDLFSFKCCLHGWRPSLLAHHVVLCGNLTLSEMDYNIPRRQMQRVMGDRSVEDYKRLSDPVWNAAGV